MKVNATNAIAGINNDMNFFVAKIVADAINGFQRKNMFTADDISSVPL